MVFSEHQDFPIKLRVGSLAASLCLMFVTNAGDYNWDSYPDLLVSLTDGVEK